MQVDGLCACPDVRCASGSELCGRADGHRANEIRPVQRRKPLLRSRLRRGRPRGPWQESEAFVFANYYGTLDRPVRTTFLDGTYEQTIYNKLDAEWQRDREGR